MSSTDELASSLRCTELLEDSPSTSGQMCRETRRRSHRVVLQPQNRRSLPAHPTVLTRKRPCSDLRLNSPQRVHVRTTADRMLHADPRVLENLYNAEASLNVNSHYFSLQEHLHEIHRSQAIDWIYDVSKEERCDPEVFPLAVSLIDRFLSLQKIFRADIQVLAGVCLFIAHKLKAPQPMSAARVAYYTADSVTVQDVLAWELLVLAELGWEVSVPTAFDFLDQLISRVPNLHCLRESFADAVHRMQRYAKFGMMLPHQQCGLALLMVAKHQQQLEFDVEYSIMECSRTGLAFLVNLVPCLESALNRDLTALTLSPVAPPSSCRTPSPLGALCQPSVPATPGNDSGFCSGVSSPESACKKELDVSPPKMARLFY